MLEQCCYIVELVINPPWVGTVSSGYGLSCCLEGMVSSA